MWGYSGKPTYENILFTNATYTIIWADLQDTSSIIPSHSFDLGAIRRPIWGPHIVRVPTSNTLPVRHEHDDGKLFVKLYCKHATAYIWGARIVRRPLFNTLETQEAVEAQLHKRILRNDCQRERTSCWSCQMDLWHLCDVLHSKSPIIPCLSNLWPVQPFRSVRFMTSFFSFRSFPSLNLTWRKERRCWRLRLRMLNSATEYEERYVEKELLGEGGFGKVGRTIKKQLMYQPIKHLVTF